MHYENLNLFNLADPIGNQVYVKINGKIEGKLQMLLLNLCIPAFWGIFEHSILSFIYLSTPSVV